MKVVIDIPEDRYADIQRIASVQLERRWPTPEQIIAKGVTINEPRNGKWIRGDSEKLQGKWRCSVCNRTTYHICADFCPNCGADMRQRDDKR